MNRDPGLINKNTKIMVKLLAEIINDFFEPLSYKTMAFAVFFVLSTLLFIKYFATSTFRKPKSLKKKS